ncbi:Geranylgeranyl transferase type II subunit alpha, partial [Intoshia linei]
MVIIDPTFSLGSEKLLCTKKNNEKYNKELTKEDTDKAKLFFDTIDDLNKAYDINDKKVTWNALSKFKKYSYNLLKLNPDILIAWSTRKKILNLIITRDIIQEIKEQFKEEFGIIDGALMENIKSYNAWSYRQWCMTQLFNFDNPEKIYDYSSEKNLFNKVFEFDARNFHCWDYFRFFSNISKNEIFLKDQVNKLITKDFSNFSAWFQNSINSSTKCPNEYNLKYLDRDLEMVNNAIYMDSNDQSSWIYLNWLIGQVSNSKSIMPICVFNKKKAKFVFWNLVLVDSMKFVIYYKNAKDTVTGDYIKPSETTFFCEFNYNYRFESMQKCEFIITYGCNDKQYYERFVVFDNSQEENNYEQFEKDGLVRMNLSSLQELLLKEKLPVDVNELVIQ